MPWPVIMLLQNFAAAIFALQSRKLQKYKQAHFQILSLIYAVLYSVSIVYILFSNQRVNLASFYNYWPRYIGGGILFGVWTFLSYRVFAYVDAAIASLLATFNIVAVVIVSSVLIHEGLNLKQLVGATLLLAAMYIVLAAKVSVKLQKDWSKGIVLSLFASITYGFAIANEKWLLNHSNVSTYAVLGLGFQWLPLLALSLMYNREKYRLIKNRHFIKQVGWAGISRAVAGLLFLISLVAANNSSLISVASGFKVILTALLAALFLNETRLLKRKLLAAFISVIGIAAIVWK